MIQYFRLQPLTRQSAASRRRAARPNRSRPAASEPPASAEGRRFNVRMRRHQPPSIPGKPDAGSRPASGYPKWFCNPLFYNSLLYFFKNPCLTPGHVKPPPICQAGRSAPDGLTVPPPAEHPSDPQNGTSSIRRPALDPLGIRKPVTIRTSRPIPARQQRTSDRAPATFLF